MACRSAANSTISTKARCPRRCGSERCFDQTLTEMMDMTRRRLRVSLALVMAIAAMSAAPTAWAQQAEPSPKATRAINAGDVLSGEVNAMRLRGGKKGKRVATYQ